VATVVTRLFRIVAPDVAIFGQKDAQQTAVVRRLERDLELNVEIIVAPTVRESDGLAMSSRNVRLSPEERRAAVVLVRALRRAEARVVEGERDPRAVEAFLAGEISAEPLAALDYAEIVSPDDFRPAVTLAPWALAVVAARFGQTRLLDNAVLSVPGGSAR
jgi:pantoate--beta-alanine ligase